MAKAVEVLERLGMFLVSMLRIFKMNYFCILKYINVFNLLYYAVKDCERNEIRSSL